MPKILFVATVVKTHIMEFHVPYLKMCKDMGWETAVAAKNDYEYPEECEIPYCDAYYNVPFERSPFNALNLKAYATLKNVIDVGQYDIIHCHTPVGAAIARLAAVDARKRGSKVFYTAHGFHFYDGAPLRNWLLYCPAEKVLARKTDVLITINREDYERARTRFHPDKVTYVPGVGLDLNRFAPHSGYGHEVRKSLEIGENDFFLLSTGELISRKNHALILRAIAKLRRADNLFQNARYVICGDGVLKESLEALSRSLGLAPYVRFVGYRNDIPKICNAADLFLLPSLQEGLPVALLEALACGLPALAMNIRGCSDIIRDGENGFLMENDADAWADKIAELYRNPSERQRLRNAARKSVAGYGLDRVLPMMKELYEDALSLGETSTKKSEARMT